MAHAIAKPYLIRFFVQFVREVTSVTSHEKLGALLLAVFFYFHQILTGAATWSDTKAAILSALVPGFWVVCGFGGYFACRAAWHVHADAVKDWELATPAAMQGWLAHRPKRPSALPGFITAATLCAVFGIAAWGSYGYSRTNQRPQAVIAPTVKEGRPPSEPMPRVNNPARQMLPGISSSCVQRENQSACEIHCTVINDGDSAAKGVAVGFQGMLPILTKLAADADTRMAIVKSELLPIPDAGGAVSKEIRAFVVEIPMVPPKTKLQFRLWTASQDNQMACQQEIRMREMRGVAMAKFYQAMSNSKPPKQSGWPAIEDVLSRQSKDASLFIPGMVSSEFGCAPVAFITSKENHAISSYHKLFQRFRSEAESIFQEMPECLAAAFTAEQTSGEPVYFTRVPAQMSVSMPMELAEATTVGSRGQLNFVPRPPKQYYCSAPPKR